MLLDSLVVCVDILIISVAIDILTDAYRNFVATKDSLLQRFASQLPELLKSVKVEIKEEPKNA